MFASPSLAARIDAAEAQLCAAIATPVPGAAVIPVAGGLAVYGRPGSPVNKVIGVCFDRALEERELAELEARGPVRVELSSLADPAAARLLTRRGYHLEGFENVLGLRLPAPPPAREPAPGIEVGLATDDELWGQVVIDGFMAPDETSEHAETFSREVLEEVFGDFVRAAGFRRYVARVEGVPAGAASLRMGGGVALLSGAATLPAFRRRGVQAALLARRLADAAAAGCDLACLTTSPGTQSQANAHRHGFELLYARAVLTFGST